LNLPASSTSRTSFRGTGPLPCCRLGQAGSNRRNELTRFDVHQPAVLRGAVVPNPGHPAFLIDQDEGVARLRRVDVCAWRHPPSHHPVASGDLVAGVGEHRRVERVLRGPLLPGLRRVGRDVEELDTEVFELLALLQVHDLLDARCSPGAHAEVQQHGRAALEVSNRHLASFGGGQRERRCQFSDPGNRLGPISSGLRSLARYQEQREDENRSRHGLSHITHRSVQASTRRRPASLGGVPLCHGGGAVEWGRRE